MKDKYELKTRLHAQGLASSTMDDLAHDARLAHELLERVQFLERLAGLEAEVRGLLDEREWKERTNEEAYDFTFKSGPWRERWNALIEITGWTASPDPAVVAAEKERAHYAALEAPASNAGQETEV